MEPAVSFEEQYNNLFQIKINKEWDEKRAVSARNF